MLQDGAPPPEAEPLDAVRAAPHKPVLDIQDLTTCFDTHQGQLTAVDHMSCTVGTKQTLGIVGESGCGKSLTALSIMRLVAPPGRITEGRVLLEGKDLLRLPETEMQAIRGNAIAMIFQDPMTSLNPVLTIGLQIAESARLHLGLGRRAARDRAEEMLRRVHIPDPRRRLDEYPHQLSGGMRQRVMIAMALTCAPKILIADEPTTALDVTIQAQILDLLLELQEESGTAIILITHDLGVVSETAQRVVVMYAGRKVEEAEAASLFASPLHPYTAGLFAARPRARIAMAGQDRTHRAALAEIPGAVPALAALPSGCRFAPRCPIALPHCHQASPPLLEHRPRHLAACWRAGELPAGHG